jgi:hypothetical protein
MPIRCALLTALLLTAAGQVPAATVPPGFVVEVLVDGHPLPEYPARGTRYIEAIRGKDYEIRLRNPLGVRVAVALAVDGLNTIDARHTSPGEARKWVLGPYETVTIRGWQVSMDEARRFYFTSEERSYAWRLGTPENMGLISAVFFRERVPEITSPILEEKEGRAQGRPDGGAPAPSVRVPEAAQGSTSVGAAPGKAGDYAATGIGRRTDHPVQYVSLELEDQPAASVTLRYEFRPQLVRLGVLPADRADDPLMRRERARGFAPGFCPEPRR